MPRRQRHDKRRERRGPMTSGEWMSLDFGAAVADDIFPTDEDRYEAWLVHREELMSDLRPGNRPEAWWDYEAPEGVPDRADYRGRYDGRMNTIVPDDDGNLTTAEYELDRLRFLASHGLLSDDEIAALLAAPEDEGLTAYARESAERNADAVLDGLTAGEDS